MKLPASFETLVERWRSYKAAGTAAEAASQLTAHAGLVLSFQEARPRFGLEIDRARRYEDPITLATVRSGAERIYRRLRLAEGDGDGRGPVSSDGAVPDEVRQLAIALMSPLIRGSVRITDLVAYDASQDDHLILFTETSRDQACRPLTRLRDRVESRFAIDVRTGLAEFPADGYTLEDLVERAREERTAPGGRLEAAGGQGEP